MNPEVWGKVFARVAAGATFSPVYAAVFYTAHNLFCPCCVHKKQWLQWWLTRLLGMGSWWFWLPLDTSALILRVFKLLNTLWILECLDIGYQQFVFPPSMNQSKRARSHMAKCRRARRRRKARHGSRSKMSRPIRYRLVQSLRGPFCYDFEVVQTDLGVICYE